MMPPDAGRPLSHMLVAVDASEASRRAVQLAIDLSRGKPRAKLTFCHVLNVPLMVARAEQCVVDYAVSLRAARDAARQMLESYRAAAREHGIETQACVRYGRPASELVTVAKLTHADLVVIGHHSASLLHRVLHGSTCDELVRSSPLPVIVAERDRPVSGAAERA